MMYEGNFKCMYIDDLIMFCVCTGDNFFYNFLQLIGSPFFPGVQHNFVASTKHDLGTN